MKRPLALATGVVGLLCCIGRAPADGVSLTPDQERNAAGPAAAGAIAKDPSPDLHAIEPLGERGSRVDLAPFDLAVDNTLTRVPIVVPGDLSYAQYSLSIELDPADRAGAAMVGLVVAGDVTPLVGVAPSPDAEADPPPTVLTWSGVLSHTYHGGQPLELVVRHQDAVSGTTWSNVTLSLIEGAVPPGTPPAAFHVGALGVGATSIGATMGVSEVVWFSFTVGDVLAEDCGVLRIDTVGSQVSGGIYGSGNDTQIGLYNSEGLLIAYSDDLDQVENRLHGAIVYGVDQGQPAPTSGSLAAGTYYLAVAGYGAEFGLSGFEVTTSAAGAGWLDVHFVLDEVAIDCDGNGVLDACEVAGGSAADVNTTGVPDECEDCDGNGIWDAWEIAAGSSPDCNGNDILDACEPDCDGNGRPDDCDTRQRFRETSGPLLVSGGQELTYTMAQAPEAVDAVRITIFRCYRQTQQDPVAELNGFNLWEVYPFPYVWDRTTSFHLRPSDFNALVAAGGGAAVFRMIPVPGIQPGQECSFEAYLTVTVEYDAAIGDCNLNDIPDRCEPDCNGNGLADACELRGTFSIASPDLPIDGQGGIPSHTFSGLPPAVGDAELAVSGRICEDFLAHERVVFSAEANGVFIGNIDLGLTTWWDYPFLRRLWINRQLLNALLDVGDGDVVVTLTPSIALTFCSPDYAFGLALRYPIVSSADCNSNGVLDQCESVLYVDASADGAGDGSSWEDAFMDLRQALNEAALRCEVSEVWVAEGTYKPAAAGGPRSNSFDLALGVGVYGGFAGDETTREQRDPVGHPTILSGDLNGDDGPGFSNREDNSYHVVTALSMDSTTVLDGFTIRGGSNAGAAGEYDGGGLFITDGPVTVRDCTFEDNQSHAGGGAYMTNAGQPTIERCRFIGNAAQEAGGGVGIRGSSPELTNNVFAGNSAGQGAAVFSTPLLAGRGGATIPSEPVLINNTLYANVATAGGAGGLHTLDSDTTVLNCIFWENVGTNGGGETAQMFADAGTLEVDYSCVEGWTGALGGTGNIGDDPMFVDPVGADAVAGTADDDLHLLPDSPCIDAGDPASPFGLEPEPDGGRINMGAYGNTPEAATRGWLYIDGYGVVNRTRVGRTEFEYQLRLTIENQSEEDFSNVVATLLDVPDNVVVVDAVAAIGSIPAGQAVVSADSFSIRVDRAVTVVPLDISWEVAFDAGGAPRQVTLSDRVVLSELPPVTGGDANPVMAPAVRSQTVPQKAKRQ